LSVEPRDSDIGWPRVSASFDFFKALRFEDEIDVRIRVVGRTSKTFHYQAIIMLGDEVAALGDITSICVRKVIGQPLKAADIPADIAARFQVVSPVESPRPSRTAPGQ
jgi:acyl-CoA thioesterase FadM